MNIKYQLQQYGTAAAMILVPATALGVYLYMRSGTASIDLANKLSASTAIGAVGLILIIGPLCGVRPWFAKLLQYRKELGILAGLSALVHFILSVFIMTDRFPLARYLENWVPPLFGLIATILFVALTVISFAKIEARMNKKIWWALQQWGVRIIFLTAIIHEFLRKYPSWLNWLNGQDARAKIPMLPPAGLLAFIFVAGILLIRLILMVTPRKHTKTVVGMGGILTFATLIAAFVWGAIVFQAK